MTNRRRRDSQANNPFEHQDDKADFSLFDADAAIYGDLEKIDATRIVAESLPIRDIFPDDTQPRRVIPSPVRVFWDGQPETTGQLFQAWVMLANQERQVQGWSPLDEAAYLLGHETPRSYEYEGYPPEQTRFCPIESALVQVLELAASIHRDGLTNPITVIHAGMKYRLETGERRWLAYHLLYHWFSDNPEEAEQWEKIPARIVNKFDVWRQATENNARTNLNAIAKARQFAILLMDIFRSQGRDFQPYAALIQAGLSDRHYYAQVADGGAFTIPRGMSEQFVSAMGMKDASQLRQLRQLLNLPDEVWQWADDLNWAVGKIRGLLLKAENDAELIGLAAQQAERDGLSVSIDTPPLPETTDDSSPMYIPGTKQHFSRFVKQLDKTGPGNTRQNRRALDMLMAHKAWLDEQEFYLRTLLD